MSSARAEGPRRSLPGGLTEVCHLFIFKLSTGSQREVANRKPGAGWFVIFVPLVLSFLRLSLTSEGLPKVEKFATEANLDTALGVG